MGEQHLGSAKTVFPEAGLVDLHKAHLPHGRRRLQLVNGLGAFRPAQALHAFRNGAAGNEDDLFTRPAKLGNLPCPAGDCRGV